MEWALAEQAAGNLGKCQYAMALPRIAGRVVTSCLAHGACRDCGLAEDALAIFEQGAAAPEPHAPLFAAYAQLAEQLGRKELAADVRQQLEKMQGALPWVAD